MVPAGLTGHTHGVLACYLGDRRLWVASTCKVCFRLTTVPRIQQMPMPNTIPVSQALPRHNPKGEDSPRKSCHPAPPSFSCSVPRGPQVTHLIALKETFLPSSPLPIQTLGRGCVLGHVLSEAPLQCLLEGVLEGGLPVMPDASLCSRGGGTILFSKATQLAFY